MGRGVSEGSLDSTCSRNPVFFCRNHAVWLQLGIPYGEGLGNTQRLTIRVTFKYACVLLMFVFSALRRYHRASRSIGLRYAQRGAWAKTDTKTRKSSAGLPGAQGTLQMPKCTQGAANSSLGASSKKGSKRITKASSSSENGCAEEKDIFLPADAQLEDNSGPFSFTRSTHTMLWDNNASKRRVGAPQ